MVVVISGCRSNTAKGSAASSTTSSGSEPTSALAPDHEPKSANGRASRPAARSTVLGLLSIASGPLTPRAEGGTRAGSLRSAVMALDTRGWLDRYTAALGSPPITDEDVEKLLALAGIAAHASERKAAPVDRKSTRLNSSHLGI